MLAHRLRLWPNIKTALGQRLMSAGRERRGKWKVNYGGRIAANLLVSLHKHYVWMVSQLVSTWSKLTG